MGKKLTTVRNTQQSELQDDTGIKDKSELKAGPENLSQECMNSEEHEGREQKFSSEECGFGHRKGNEEDNSFFQCVTHSRIDTASLVFHIQSWC